MEGFRDPPGDKNTTAKGNFGRRGTFLERSLNSGQELELSSCRWHVFGSHCGSLEVLYVFFFCSEQTSSVELNQPGQVYIHSEDGVSISAEVLNVCGGRKTGCDLLEPDSAPH